MKSQTNGASLSNNYAANYTTAAIGAGLGCGAPGPSDFLASSAAELRARAQQMRVMAEQYKSRASDMEAQADLYAQAAADLQVPRP